MDFAEVALTTAITLILTLISYLHKSNSRKQDRIVLNSDKIESKLQALQNTVLKDYVTKDELNQTIETRLKRIEDQQMQIAKKIDNFKQYLPSLQAIGQFINDTAVDKLSKKR